MNTRIVSSALVGLLSLLAATVSAQVTVSTAINTNLSEPYDVVVDSTNNFYVSDSVNNRIVRFDASTEAASTLAGIAGDAAGSNDGPPDQAHFNNPQGLLAVSIGGVSGLLVADSGNNLIRFVCFSNGVVTTLAGQIAAGPSINAAGLNATFRVPMGFDQDTNGDVYIADWGNNAIRVMNLNDPAFGITNVMISGTSFNRPTALAFAGTNQLWVADTGNQMVKLITLATPTSGSLATYVGGYKACGTTDATFGPSARFNNPSGLLWVNGLGLLISDTRNNSLRLATNNPAYGATNYAVATFAGISGTENGGLQDGSAATAKFNSPLGLTKENGFSSYLVADLRNNAIRHIQNGPPRPVAPTILSVQGNYGEVDLTWSSSPGATTYNVKRSPSNGGPYTTIANSPSTGYSDTTVINGTTYYYVVSAVGLGGESPNSTQVSVTPPLPPVPDPKIGWVEFPPPLFNSVFHEVSSYVANNDVTIVIEGAPGSVTYYNYGETPATGSINDPTSSYSSANVGYEDGLSADEVAYYSVTEIMPDLTMKAIGEKNDGSPNSAIVMARFQFVTANPTISGNNAAQFTVTDITENAQIWYTVDGSDPTNASSSVGPITSGTTLSLQFPPSTNSLTFKAIAFRDHYQPSGVVSAVFSSTNFVASTISFGFASGEASSDFVGSPGQYFYAPVTLAPLPGVMMYSLQFNLTVTNAGWNPGPPIVPNAFSFKSFLMKPIPGTMPVVYEPIPPLSFIANATDPPPPDQIVVYDGTNFVNMLVTNTSLNLLGVGWLERYGMTNLYVTMAQELISYSIAHDTLFTPDQGKVIAGGYAFQIPPSASAGQTYQIQIGRPSATSDGIGRPGADVYIATPTNGSLAGGAINSVKVVTVGQRKYIAGDSAPFRWFNAGDFGNTNLNNSDVEQVFQSAIYDLDSPPAYSDFFDGMDSCGGTYMDLGHGYLEFNTYVSGPGALDPLFYGNDTSINQIAFGDGVLDVCDVYVTYRRSLDPSLTWFRRFWTNGVRAAEAVFPQPKVNSQVKLSGSPAQPKDKSLALTNPPSANFAASDAITSAGQTVQIPITASIFGNYPLRVMALNLSVVPLDGSPALTSPIQFSANVALGAPALASSTGNGNYAAAWLDSTIAGLTGNATLGTLTVTIPANATSSAAYAVHFDHVSASPNGIAAFPKQSLTGLITLSSRTTSAYNDGIPDSWRLRWFGTIYSALSAASADACGDGINNWEKYIAGTDPTDPKAFPRLHPITPTPSGAAAAIHWPTVSGKQYVIERSTTLFPGSWTAIATNVGTGTDMEYDDSTGGKASFYRVRILP